MKKYILAIICAMLMTFTLVGCGNTENEDSEKISIVTTIFPEYDWVREIVGENENVEITMLLDNGVDLHSFQPTTEDIAKVASCDMFIYVGGESDGWAEDALEEATNKDMVVINLLDVLGDSVKEEELVEGMQGEEEEEGPEYDEHVWLSLKNAEILCQKIEEELEKIDAENASQYEKNAKAYLEKLDALDQEYEDAVAAGSQKTVLFGDRFPFRYLVDDYNLDYYAAFVGCSAESGASFETITFLANKVDELGLSSIFQIESSDGKIAETIKENTTNQNQQILVLDSMQATTSSDVENGTTYLSVMQSNLEVLKEALN
ncbi:MAG: metal ABC transporter substrate-binding protein [Roseburia sp.]